jgi:hypothetical protein
MGLFASVDGLLKEKRGKGKIGQKKKTPGSMRNPGSKFNVFIKINMGYSGAIARRSDNVFFEILPFRLSELNVN